MSENWRKLKTEENWKLKKTAEEEKTFAKEVELTLFIWFSPSLSSAGSRCSGGWVANGGRRQGCRRRGDKEQFGVSPANKIIYLWMERNSRLVGVIWPQFFCYWTILFHKNIDTNTDTNATLHSLFLLVFQMLRNLTNKNKEQEFQKYLAWLWFIFRPCLITFKFNSVIIKGTCFLSLIWLLADIVICGSGMDAPPRGKTGCPAPPRKFDKIRGAQRGKTECRFHWYPFPLCPRLTMP